MDVHVERDTFFRAIQLVQNIVEPRQTLPVLSNVLIEANDGELTVTATDLEVGVCVKVPATVQQTGKVTLSAKKLLEIVKELPPKSMALTVQEHAWVFLRCGGASYKLVGLPAEDFPTIQEISGVSVVLAGRAVREMLSRTAFAVSHDETRRVLNGVFFLLQEKDIRCVATDGHRLALAQRDITRGQGTASGIVPRKAVQEIGRVLSGDEEIQLTLSENQFSLRTEKVLLTARLIEGQFLNYEQVIPRQHQKRVLIPREEFAAIIRRVSVLSEERTKPVKIQISTGVMKMTASSPELGEAEEALEVEYDGDEVIIGFNSRYLLEAISPIEMDRISLELKDGLSPGVIKGVGEEDTLCVIMPMRI
ncbi:MAG TPA: DNA polymerase III subunit beta [Methylomirabilota bacterium]|nr:DNA polymerase III subunit beta [Methylomirabilota bacterium]